jgi:hypothetical protein
VTRDAPAGHPHLVPDLGAAVRAWNARPPGTVGVIALLDSRSYSEALSGENAITVPGGSRLTIVAADWPAEDRLDPQTGVPLRTPGRLVAVGRRPHLRGEIEVRGTAPASSTDPGVLAIDGLLLEGSLTVLPGNLGALRLSHSTLAPRRQLQPPPAALPAPPTPPVAPPPAGRLIVQPAPEGAPAGQQNERLQVSLERCITGPLEVAGPVDRLQIEGSVIDGQGRPALTGPDAVVRQSTILGRTLVRSLEASNAIFFGSVGVSRRQVGCVRFSYLPLSSLAARRYRCQPADAAGAPRAFPQFVSLRYGDPGYAQLAPGCPVQIARGADDEGEMGAFHFLQRARRESSLRASLDEYLRLGLEAGIFFVT